MNLREKLRRERGGKLKSARRTRSSSHETEITS
jgi:hypothetical protein